MIRIATLATGSASIAQQLAQTAFRERRRYQDRVLHQ